MKGRLDHKLHYFLAAHNKGGQECHDCGNKITANKWTTSYCRRCRTGILIKNRRGTRESESASLIPVVVPDREGGNLYAIVSRYRCDRTVVFSSRYLTLRLVIIVKIDPLSTAWIDYDRLRNAHASTGMKN